MAVEKALGVEFEQQRVEAAVKHGDVVFGLAAGRAAGQRGAARIEDERQEPIGPFRPRSAGSRDGGS